MPFRKNLTGWNLPQTRGPLRGNQIWGINYPQISRGRFWLQTRAQSGLNSPGEVGGGDVTIGEMFINREGQSQVNVFGFELLKFLFSYKIFMIKKVCECKIREFRSITNVMYNRLNDWIIATIRSDNAFIFNMVFINS